MASKGRPWLLGCGIGCGILLLIGLLLAGGGFLVARKVVQRAGDIEESTDAVVARFGAIEDFRPPADGRIEAARVEAFLEVRERCADARTTLGAQLAELSDSNGAVWKISKIKATVSMVSDLFSFLEQRNQALLAAGMGAGEYLYLYDAAFFGLLGHSPADGPPFSLSEDTESGEWRWSSDDEDPAVVRERRQARFGRLLNRQLRPMIRHQLTDLEAMTDRSALAPGWEAALRAEVAALTERPHRWPWRDGLPEPLRGSLELFATRIAESWAPLINPLDMIFDED